MKFTKDNVKGFKGFIRFFLIGLFTGLSLNTLFAQQDKNPVEPEIKYSLSKTEASVGDVVEVILTGNIPPTWYVYSNDFDENLGPMQFFVSFDNSKGVEVVGKPYPVGAKKKQDETWGGEVSVFTKKFEMRQKLKITSAKPEIKGEVEYQMCSEVSGLCVLYPIKYPNEFSLSGLNIKGASKEGVLPKADLVEPEDTSLNTAIDNVKTDTGSEEKVVNKDELSQETKEIKQEGGLKNQSGWTLFLIGLAAGILAVLTPCVFPMIPMTVAFFTKRQDKGKGRKMALFYGFSIIFIYTSIGLILSAFFGATFGYAISTHWFPNLLFFAIFIVFGISFLGAFEIVLPSNFVNNIDKKSDRGGYIGVFFIALTLVVISFSCTAPVVGSVAILAESGEIIRPLVALLGFSLSFALPFTFFAFFPSLLKSLPKSGGWLNSVKVVFGFLEIALALKFFSQADLAYHWGILNRDIFLSVWIVLSILLGLYLLGKLKFSHDSDLPFISVPRFLLALAFFSFGMYMIPGLWGAPLKPLAGILPPLTTQDYVVQKGNSTSVANTTEEITSKHSDILHLPYNLQGYYDFKEGLEAIKKTGKPGFLDFTGHSCANCRKMEEDVWPSEQVLSKLREDVVIISLYVDEKRELPESEWYTSERDGRLKKTVGAQNHDLEISRYNQNAQPYYFMVDENGNVLSEFGGYENNPEKFAGFIEEGIKKFNERKK